MAAGKIRSAGIRQNNSLVEAKAENIRSESIKIAAKSGGIQTEQIDRIPPLFDRWG